MLALMVVSLVFLTIFDAKIFAIQWRITVKELQAFLGGLSVLAASLFALYASHRAAGESRRKNFAEEERLQENVILKTYLTVDVIRRQSEIILNDLYVLSDNYRKPEISIFHFQKMIISMPAQTKEIINNLSSVPLAILNELAELISLTEIYMLDHSWSSSMYDKQSVAMNSMRENLFETSKSPMFIDCSEIASQMEVAELYMKSFGWKRCGDLLERIHKLSLSILKKLPPSMNVEREEVNYPSNISSS